MSESPRFKKTADQQLASYLLGQDQKHTMLYGGSRSGKTFILVYALIVRAAMFPSRHCILRKHFNTLKKAIWYDTLPKVMALCFPDLKYYQNKSDWFVSLPNGSEIWFGGLDNKERAEKILGNEYATIYFNECSEISYDSVMIALTRLAQKTGLRNKVYYDENPPLKSHWSYKLFFKGVDPVDNIALKNPGDYKAMLMNPEGNKENLADGYIETTLETLSARLKDRFLKGLFLDDLAGALWNREMINRYRVVNPPDAGKIVRVVIGLDPAVTSNANSCLTGIVGACETVDGHYYVLDDDSLRGTPLEWGQAAIDCYDRLNADTIVGEVNNGGDLVEANLRAIRKNISYMSVRATRGKIVRAEPIANLYEQGKVHHVGELPELEDEMCSYDPETSTTSPDRMDSLVWSITALSEKMRRAGTWG